MVSIDEIKKYRIKGNKPSLAKMNPYIAKQFHPVLNGYVRAADVNYDNRSAVFWWLCEKGHEWQEKLNNRKYDSTCPKCRLYENSLAKKYPELLREWDYEKNVGANPQEVPWDYKTKKYWWRCDQSHSFMLSVNARTMGKESCAECQAEHTLLKNVYPNLIKEWSNTNEVDLNRVSVQSKLNYAWLCKEGHIWRASISDRMNGASCEECELKNRALTVVAPEISEEWSSRGNRITPDRVLCSSRKKYWWECKVHKVRWQQTPSERYEGGKGCPQCDLDKNSITKAYPELAKEWAYGKNPVYVTPDVVSRSNYSPKIWWRCEEGHEWAATLKSRIDKGQQCPKCIENLKTLDKVLSPRMLEEWALYLNGGKMPNEIELKNRNSAYSWVCKEKGHLEKETITMRNRRGGNCLKCEEEKTSFAYNAPIEVLTQWDVDKNDGVTPFEVYYKSNKKYWWINNDRREYMSPQMKLERYCKS